MPMDIATLKTWTEDLGLRVEVQGEPGGETLRATAPGGALLVIKPAGRERRQIAHYCRVSVAEIKEQWGAPGQPEPPAELFTRLVENLATGYPLLRIMVTDEGQQVLVAFEATVYDEGLGRQAYAWTLSAVLKATEAFTVIRTERARQVAAWAGMTPGPAPTAESVRAARSAAKAPATAPPPTPTTAQAAVAREPAFCPRCGSKAESGTAFCGSCGQRLATPSNLTAN